jgi:hypothetical protein
LPCYSSYYWSDIIVHYNLFLLLYTLHLIQILIGTLPIVSKICSFPVFFIMSTNQITVTSHMMLNTDNFCHWQCNVLVVKKALVKIVHPKKVSHQYNYFKLHWRYLHFSQACSGMVHFNNSHSYLLNPTNKKIYLCHHHCDSYY